MLEWVADRVPVYKARGWGWRVWASLLVAFAVVAGAVIVYLRRRAAEQRDHESFVAGVDAREREDEIQDARADAQVEQLRERAKEAQARADQAKERAKEAQAQHDQALDAIDRVRSWRDVRPRRR